jgi:ATP-dependent exoDNAse (exonuclease V) beta subunit
MTAVPHQAFNYTEWPLPVGTVVDASAGTGKTYEVKRIVQELRGAGSHPG